MRSSLVTEATVLGSCMIHGASWWSKVVELAGDIDSLFYDSNHKLMAKVFSKSLTETNSIDEHIIYDYLVNQLEHKNDVEKIITSLKKHASITTVGELTSSVSKLSSDRASREIASIADKAVREATNLSPFELKDILDKANDVQLPVTSVPTMADLMDELESETRSPWAVPIGLNKLDEALDGGWESGKSYVVAASAKVGKSTFMFSCVERALSAGAVVIVFSLETIKHDFRDKMMSNVSGLDRREFIKPFTNTNELKKMKDLLSSYDKDTREGIIQARAFLRESKLYPVFESDMPKGFDDIAPIVRNVQEKHPNEPVVCFVDHLGLLVNDMSKKDTRIQLEHFTKSFAKMARNNGIAVVLLVQINRGAGEGEPMPEHLRGSGTIEQDANSVILLHRKRTAQINDGDGDFTDDMDPNNIQIHLALNRSGPVCKFNAFFDGAIDTISDKEEEDD